MGYLILLVLVVVVIFIKFGQGIFKNQNVEIDRKNQDKDTNDLVNKLPYIKKASLTTKAEYSFYKVIEVILDDNYIICPKISLSDVFEVNTSANEKMKYFNKIARKHVDFLICDKKNMKPLIGIELDDSSHQRKNRIERDKFFNKLFDDANLKLLRYPVKQGYVSNELRSTIEEEIENYFSEVSDSVKSYVCPNCKTPMMLRTVNKGKNKGNEFYGCPNYPKCKETINLT